MYVCIYCQTQHTTGNHLHTTEAPATAVISSYRPPAPLLANTQATHQTVAINQNHKPSDGYLYLGSGNQNICTLTDP